MSLSRKDKQFLTFAKVGASLFSTCSRRQYMAILTDENHQIVGMGYNGGPPKFQHCINGGCPRVQENPDHGSVYDNCIAIHAEQNAFLHSNYVANAYTLYVNGPPCFTCAKLIANSTVKRVVCMYDPEYAEFEKIVKFLNQAQVEVIWEDRSWQQEE